MIFYFSGTGNSRWVAGMLADLLHDELVPMAEESSLSATYSWKPGEKVGFVFPVYAWAPPKLVLDFIARVKMEKPEYLYFVCTCGDDTGKTGEVFVKALKERCWDCQAGYSVTMPNTYVSLPGFDVDDPDTERMKVQHAKARVEFIADELAKKVRMASFNCHEGAVPFLKTYVIRPFFNRFLMSPEPFRATDACISCKRCEKKCPVHNIKVEAGGPCWGNHCTQCLACYHVCPVHAIRYGNRTEGKGQYKGEHLK